MEAILAGSTGLVGRNILQQLLGSAKFTSVHAYTRRSLPDTTSKSLKPISTTDTESWPSLFPGQTETPADRRIFFTALGTTRAIAGSFEAQRKVDYDLNVALAKAAREAGVETCVLISTSGANANSMIPYSKMKGELDDAIEHMGFKHTVILRPGLIMGVREDSRPGEVVARKVAAGLKAISGGALTNFWAQEAEIIARAAVNAGLECVQGAREPGLWLLGQADVVKWGSQAQ